MIAPERIWAWVWDLPYPSKCQGKAEWSSVAYPEDQEAGDYLLSTPAALARAPEVMSVEDVPE